MNKCIKENKEKRGFTLVELLAVIVVLGICTGIGISVSRGLLNKNSAKAKEVNLESVYKSAIMYTEEYKKADDWVVDVNRAESSGSNVKTTGDEFICMSVKNLIDKGYIDRDASLPDNVTMDSLLLLKRNRDTKSYEKLGDYIINNESECKSYDDQRPSVVINLNSSSNSNGWYTSDIGGNITATTGKSGIKEKNYFYEVDGVKTAINGDSFNIDSDGSSIRICGSITNGLGISSSEECVGPLKRDTSKPSLSIDISSKASNGNWYNSDINGNIIASAGKSGIKSVDYYIDIDGKKETYNTTVSNSNFAISKEGKVIRICGKVVNGAGVSSGDDMCIGPLGLDKTKPILSSKGNIGSSNIDPVYTDNLGTVTVKKCITTSKTVTKGDSCFNSATYPSYVSGTTYYLFSYGVDSAGNESDVVLNNEYTYVYHSSNSGSHRGSGSSCNATCQMKKNSEKWHEVNNNNSLSQSEKKSQQDALHRANEKLAKGNSDCKGSCSYNNNSGTWSDSGGKNLYNSSDLKNASKNSNSNRSSSKSSSSRSSSSSNRRSSSSKSSSSSAKSAATKAAKSLASRISSSLKGRR